MGVVIFTDLDASLLDHDGYGFSGAAQALAQIKTRRIPLIAVTSKCRSEVDLIRADIGIDDPFIVENGAALFVPKGYRGLVLDGAMDRQTHMVFQWGLAYRQIRSALAQAQRRFPLRGFGDMDVAEVAKLTGLPLEKAALARQREFTEPFVLKDPTRLVELQQWAAARQLAIARGGRFFHLMSAGQDKGRAVAYLTGLLQHHSDEKLVTIGIGDSPNDESMLAVVDLPVVLPQATGAVAAVNVPGVMIGAMPGSHGWNEAVLRLLDTVALPADPDAF